MDHGVALIPLDEGFQDLQGDGRIELAYQIHRIGTAPVGRQDLVDFRDDVRGKMGRLQPRFDAEVGGHHPPAAAQGEHGHPFALRQGEGGKRRGQIEEIHGLIRDHHAGLAAGGIEDLDVGRHGAGVAGGGAVARRRAASLQDDHRFFLRHPPGGGEEAPTVLDALYIEDYGLGQIIHLETVQIVLDGDHRLIARTGEGPDADPFPFGEGQQLGAQIARLGHKSDGAGLGPHRGAGAVEFPVGVEDSHSVGPKNHHAGRGRFPDQFPFHIAAFRAYLAESGGDEEHVFDSPNLKFRDQVPDLGCRQRDDAEIDVAGDVGHG